MTKPIIKIVNAETGEEIEREMNEDELVIWQQNIGAEEQADIKAAELAAAKAALLKKLGITEDEAKLLLS